MRARYLPRHSDGFDRAFSRRPKWAVPKFYTIPTTFSLATGIESGVGVEADVPADVNGFRVEYVYTQSSQGALRVRLYVREIRNPAGPTFDIPQLFDVVLGSGIVPMRYPVAWLVEPGDHWQLTIRNAIPAGTMTNCWAGISGYLF